MYNNLKSSYMACSAKKIKKDGGQVSAKKKMRQGGGISIKKKPSKPKGGK